MTELGNLISLARNEKCGDNKYPVLSMTMHQGLVLQSDKFKKTIASKDRSEYKVVRRGQLVVSFPIDEGVLAAQRIVDAGIVSPAYNIWNIDQDAILPHFLEYALRCDRAIEYYKSRLRGSTARRRSLPKESFLQFEIPVPSISEQQHILHVLQTMEDILRMQKQQLESLDTLIKARFVEMFGDPVRNSRGWKTSQLSEFILFLTSGSRGWSQYFTDEGEYFITIKNVKNCKITLNEVQHVNPPKNMEAIRTRVKEHDLLISITADLGRTGIVTRDIEEHGAYINEHLTCIRLDTQKVNPVYVAWFLESEGGKRQFSAKNQSAVKAGLNFNAINSLELAVPPLLLQDRFAAFVSEVDKSKAVVQKALEKTQLLRASLMQQYFS